MNGHEYSEANTYWRDGWRTCRACASKRKRDWRRNREPKAPHPAVDYLQADGGWLTAEGIALEIHLSADATSRALHRARSLGLVEVRSVGLAFKKGRRGMERRLEWRFIPEVTRGKVESVAPGRAGSFLHGGIPSRSLTGGGVDG